MSKKHVLVVALVPAVIVVTSVAQGLFGAVEAAEEVKSGGNGPEKAIISTAEVMKLLIDPTYETLKDAVENPPQKRAEWRALYVASFSLAELTNLMYSRGDEEFQHTPDWETEAKKSQEIVSKLAESVRSQSDYTVIKENYMAVVADCNACHRKFEPGEVDEIVPPTSWGNAQAKATSDSLIQ